VSALIPNSGFVSWHDSIAPQVTNTAICYDPIGESWLVAGGNASTHNSVYSGQGDLASFAQTSAGNTTTTGTGTACCVVKDSAGLVWMAVTDGSGIAVYNSSGGAWGSALGTIALVGSAASCYDFGAGGVAFGAAGVLKYTKDSGSTWTTPTATGPWAFCDGLAVRLAATSGAYYRVNAGAWTGGTLPIATGDTPVAVAPGLVAVRASGGASTYLLASYDGNVTWTKIKTLSSSWPIASMVGFADSYWAITTAGKVIFSDDGGITWRQTACVLGGAGPFVLARGWDCLAAIDGTNVRVSTPFATPGGRGGIV
jgi:hypothetical protein